MQQPNNGFRHSKNDIHRQEGYRHPHGGYGRRFSVDRSRNQQSGRSIYLNIILFRKPAGTYVTVLFKKLDRLIKDAILLY